MDLKLIALLKRYEKDSTTVQHGKFVPDGKWVGIGKMNPAGFE